MWYRATTQRKADSLGLDGWAKNLHDGRVEVVARGPADSVAELCGWLWEGSPAARVESVSVSEFTEAVAPGFVTV